MISQFKHKVKSMLESKGLWAYWSDAINTALTLYFNIFLNWLDTQYFVKLMATFFF